MEEKFCKVTFPLAADDWHGRAKEDLWAIMTQRDENEGLFCIKSTPFFTTSVSKMDVVRAIRSREGSSLDFTDVDHTGGHSTYMILAEPQQTGFGEYMDKLAALKCQFEATKIGTSIGERILF